MDHFCRRTSAATRSREGSAGPLQSSWFLVDPMFLRTFLSEDFPTIGASQRYLYRTSALRFCPALKQLNLEATGNLRRSRAGAEPSGAEPLGFINKENGKEFRREERLVFIILKFLFDPLEAAGHSCKTQSHDLLNKYMLSRANIMCRLIFSFYCFL